MPDCWTPSLARRLVCLASIAVLAGPSSAQQGGRTGQIDLLFIRADWSDRTMGISDALWTTRLNGIHGEGETYWQFHSAGAITNHTAAITPMLRFNGPGPTAANPAEVWDVRAQMVALAEGAGYVINDYDHIVLSYPSAPHTFSFGALGTPGTVWMPGSNPWGPGFIHELGHAFGVGHASHYEGGPNVFPGQHREGRDGLFMMGSEGGAMGGRSTINMPMRYAMNHAGDAQVKNVDGPQVVRLFEFELAAYPDGKYMAARIDAPGVLNRDWWLSFAPTMVDRWSAFNSEGFGRGIIVQELNGSITRSLDFTPQSQGGIGTNEEDYVDSRDGALQIDQRFTFPGTELSLEPLAIGVQDGLRWIDVAIDFGNGIPGLDGNYCGPAALNSADLRATMSMTGSKLLSANDLVLQATEMPANRFGYFIVSDVRGFVVTPGSSAGNLCLAGGIGRYAGQIMNTGPSGSASLAVEAAAIPTPTGSVAAQIGQSWNWQFWFRDSFLGVPSSNFTDGYTVTWE